MNAPKARVTLTLDPHLLAAASAAVAAGKASSVSQWVNTALAERIDNENRLRGLRRAIRAYEREFGRLTDDEVRAQRAADDREAAVNQARSPSRKSA